MILSLFFVNSDEIEKRKKMRMRKQRDEKRRSKKIEMEENKKFGIGKHQLRNVTSQFHSSKM